MLRIDREPVYDEYIAVASDNAHSSLDVLERARENCAYDAVMSAISIEECERFLKKYPDALQEHSSAVSELRTDILFEEASRSTDEKLISSFIESYPKYARVDELKAYLADLNYSYMEATGVKFVKSSLTMKKGETTVAKVKLGPTGCTDTVTFKSSNKNIVIVNKSTGKLRAKAKGKAVITVKTGSGKTAKLKVAVK